MKQSRFTEHQIIKILKEAEAGVPVTDLCRQHGFSRSGFYKWKAKYGGMDASSLKRLKELEEENRKLKQMYADLSLELTVLKDIIEKKLQRSLSAVNWQSMLWWNTISAKERPAIYLVSAERLIATEQKSPLTMK